MRIVSKMMAPLARRVRLMISRCVVLGVNDALKLQGLQISLLADEVRDGAERMQQYGFTSHPHPGAEAVAVFPAGNRDHPLVIATDDRRYRPRDLQPGESALYTDEDVPAQDHRVVLRRGKIIELRAGASTIVMGPGGITITTPSFDLNQG